MKKMSLVATLLLGSLNLAQASLLDAVTETATALTAAKATGAGTDKALLMELLKSKVLTGATKDEVRSKLGEPKVVTQVAGNDVWKYGISSLDAKASAAVAVAGALEGNNKLAQKIVELKFEGNTVKSYDIVEGSLTN